MLEVDNLLDKLFLAFDDLVESRVRSGQPSQKSKDCESFESSANRHLGDLDSSSPEQLPY